VPRWEKSRSKREDRPCIYISNSSIISEVIEHCNIDKTDARNQKLLERLTMDPRAIVASLEILFVWLFSHRSVLKTVLKDLKLKRSRV
jgi:hypothetical protein